MRVKVCAILCFLLLGFIHNTWGQLQAGFSIYGIPNNPGPVAATNGASFNICQGGVLTLYNAAVNEDSICYSVNNAAFEFNPDVCDYFNSVSNPIYVVFNNTGPATVTQTAIKKGKKSVVTITVNVNNTYPTADFTTPSLQCASNTFNFVNASEPGAGATITSYSWTFNGSSTTSSTVKNPSIIFDKAIGNLQNYQYPVQLTVTNSFGCSNSTFNKTVSVNQIPDVNISSSNASKTIYGNLPVFTFCNGLATDTFNFNNASSTNATNTKYDIKWGNPAGEVFDSIAWEGTKRIVYGQGFDTINVSIKGGDGCINTKQFGVYVGQQPGSGLNSPQGKTVFCIGTTIPFAFTQSDSSNPAGTSYEITIRENPLFDTIVYQSDILKNWPYYFVHTFNQSSCGANDPRGSDPNAFAVNINAINACASALNGPGTIHISARPVVQIQGPKVLCNRDTALFTNNSTWYGVFPYCSSITPQDAQQVWKVIPPPGGSYKILNNAGSLNPYISGDKSINVAFYTNGTYDIRLYVKTNNTNAADCVTGDSSSYTDIFVCVRDAPYAKFKLDKKSACVPYTFIASQLPDTTISCVGDSLTWSVDTLADCVAPAGHVIIDTGNSASKARITFPQPGKYVITLSVASTSGGCTSYYYDTVNVYKQASISLDTSIGSICSGSSILPQATVDSCFSSGPLSYSWFFGGGTPATASGLTPPTVTYQSASPAGRDTIKFSATNGCGTVTDTAYVSVISKPQVDTVPGKTICSGTSVNIALTSKTTGISFLWRGLVISGHATGVTPTGNTATIADMLASTDKSVVEYKVWGSLPGGTCTSDTMRIYDTVLPIVQANAGIDQYLCKGTDSTALAATRPTPGSGKWTQVGTPAATIRKNDDPNTNVAGLLPNNDYVFVWTISGSSSPCVISTDTVHIYTDTIVNVIDQPTSICASDDVTIKGHVPAGADSASYTYQWLQSRDAVNYSPVTTVPSTNRDITLPPSAYKYFRRIVYYHSCADTSNTVVILINNTRPVASFAPKDTTGCGPLTITFTNTTTPAPATQFAYQWFVDNNVVGTAPDVLTHTFNTTVSGYGDTSYQFILVASNGCFTNADTAVVNVRSKPRASFSPDTSSGCSPMVVNFTNNSVGSNVSYTWNFGDGKGNQNFSAHSFTYTYNVHTHTDFKVTLQAANTCGTSSDSTIISVNANAIALHFGVSAPLNFGCTGDSVFFKNNTTGANIFNWSFGDNGSPNNTQITTDSFGIVNHVYKKPGTYMVQLCAANSCTKDTCGSLVIYVKQKPKAIFTASPDTVCTSELVTTVNNSQPADSALAYQWTFGDGSGIYTDKAPAHRYTTSGSDTIWLAVSALYDQGFACRDSAYQTIVVNGPTGQLTYTDSACAGGQITYQVNSTNTATYTFDFGDNTPPVTTPTPVIKHSYAHPGIYLPKVTLTTGNCSKLVAGVDSIRVDSIQAAFTVDSIPFCDSTKLLLKDNSYAYFGIQHYAWVINTSKYSGSTANYTITRTTNPLPVSLQVTGATGCVSQAASPLNVYVHQTPSGKIAINSDTCAMQSVSFSASVFSNDATQYFWRFGNGDRKTGQNVTTVFNPPGVYADTLVAVSSFGCADTVTGTVTIKTTPYLKINPPGPINLCAGKTQLLTATGDSITSWGWSPVNGLSCPTCNNPLATPTSTIQYTVTGTNSAGCSSNDSVTVNVIQPFTVHAVPTNTSICLPDTLQPIQFFASGAYRYTWSPATWLSDSTAFNPVVNVPYNTLTTSGTFVYHVTGYDQYHCFTHTDSVTLAIGLQPIIKLGVGDTGVAGRLDTISPLVLLNGPYASFTWTINGKGVVKPLNKLGDTVQVTINGEVTFIVTATNIYGCSVTDTIHYSAYCSQIEGQLYIPNAFSPDNDNINDVFMVQGRGIIVEYFKVFNRWGQQVFDGGSNFDPNLPTRGWDGKVNGQPATDDVYVYIVKARCTASDVPFFQKGNVTLFRVKK